MAGDIVFGIRLKYDGKEVTGGVDLNRADFKRLAVDVRDAGKEVAGASTHAASKLRSISDQLGQAKNAALSYFGATQALQASRWIVEQASAMQQMDARLKVATASVKDYQTAQAGVFEVANRWGAAVEQTAAAFARLNPVVGQMGGSAATTLKMLDGLSASLRLSGATAGETNAVLMQFSQAMGSGRVGGDEFRTMMESAEPLMRAAAGQLGKTTAELRQMAEEGKLTSSVFGNALLPAMDKLKAQAASIPLGVDQAWQVLKNNLSQAFGREFEASATGVAGAIRSVSENAAPAAAAVHALGYALLEAGKGAAVLGAGALGLWLKNATAATYEKAAASIAARVAAEAEARAAVAVAETNIAAAQSTLAWTAVEREKALAQLASANATLAATRAMGAHSAALAANIEATVAHKAALLLAADASRMQAVATRELAAAEVALVAAKTGVTTAAGAARTAMMALGGPIGVVTTLLAAGAMAWMAWGGAAETAAERVDKELADMAKRRKFGAGSLGDLKAEQAALAVKRLESFSTEGSAAEAQYKAIVAEMAKNDQRIAEYEKNVADAAKPGGTSDERLSSAGQWGALTKELKWREKLLADHGIALSNLAVSNADRYAAAVAKGVPLSDLEKIARENTAAAVALKREQRGELNSLPEAKEGTAVAAARLDADGARLKAWHEEYRDTVKRALDESRTDYEGYWALVMAGEQRLAEEQLRIATARSSAAAKRGDRAEVIKLAGEVDALRARLNTGISAETERGLAGDLGKAKSAGSNAQLDAANADAKALATAAAWRRENLSLLDQELAAAREKSAADLRERQAQLDKNEALKHAPELLKQYRQAAADQAESTLAGIEAEILARQRANSEWGDAALKGLRDYREEAAKTAASVADSFKRGAKLAEDALANFVATGKLDIASLAKFAATEIARQNFAKPAVSVASNWLSGALTSVLGIGGFSASEFAAERAAHIDNAVGGIYASADLHQYANTIVSSPTLFKFAQGGAFRKGLMGEAGPEAIMPLKRMSGGDLGVKVQASGAGGDLQVIINDQRTATSSAPVSVEQSSSGDGMRQVRILIRDEVRGLVGSGQLDSSMRASYGVGRTLTKRG